MFLLHCIIEVICGKPAMIAQIKIHCTISQTPLYMVYVL